MRSVAEHIFQNIIGQNIIGALNVQVNGFN